MRWLIWIGLLFGACSVRAQAPLLALGFEETAGLTAVDSSGATRDCTLVGNLTRIAGKYGQGISLPGNARVNCPSFTLGQFTFAAWVLPPTHEAYETLITLGTVRDFYLRDGFPAFYTGTDREFGVPALALGQWTHVAVTYNGLNLRFYQNGAKIGSDLPVTLGTVTGTLRLGAWPLAGGFTDYFLGSMDEIRIYGRALTETEIASDRDRPVVEASDTTPPSVPGPLTVQLNTPTENLLTWVAATDNRGVVEYEIERCTGVGCETFAPLNRSSALSFTDTGLERGQSYRYAVAARDESGNRGAFVFSGDAWTLPVLLATFLDTTETAETPRAGTLAIVDDGTQTAVAALPLAADGSVDLSNVVFGLRRYRVTLLDIAGQPVAQWLADVTALRVTLLRPVVRITTTVRFRQNALASESVSLEWRP
jgi:Fibronectin type III domain.